MVPQINPHDQPNQIGRRGVNALLLATILLLGVGLRVNCAWEGRAPVFDAAAYATIAGNLDEDRGFTLGRTATQPASNYSPGLPLLAAGIYEVTGGVHERTARLVLAVPLRSSRERCSRCFGRRAHAGAGSCPEHYSGR